MNTNDKTLMALGKIMHPLEEFGRDAVHIAVAPVIAPADLAVCQEVTADGYPATKHAGIADPTVGIVDPFLRCSVKKGQKFWLYLFPASVTDMRHEWSHPAFKEEEQDNSVIALDSKGESALWMKNWCDEFPIHVEEMLEAADDWIAGGEYFSQGGRFEGEYVPDVFWDHYQVLRGRLVNSDDRHSFFSCAC